MLLISFSDKQRKPLRTGKESNAQRLSHCTFQFVSKLFFFSSLKILNSLVTSAAKLLKRNLSPLYLTCFPLWVWVLSLFFLKLLFLTNPGRSPRLHVPFKCQWSPAMHTNSHLAHSLSFRDTRAKWSITKVSFCFEVSPWCVHMWI